MSPFENFEHREVAETEDTAAENQFKQLALGDVNNLRDNLVDKFTDSPILFNKKEAQEFKDEFQQALDDLIDKGVDQNVNVLDIRDLPSQKIAEIKKIISNRLVEFSRKVAEEVQSTGEKTPETIQTARRELASFFEIDYASGETARETNNDAEFTFTVETKTVKTKGGGEKEKAEAITLTYKEKNVENPSSAQMTIETNERFFQSEAETEDGDLANRIDQNREAYRLKGVNYEIEDPAGFSEFIKGKIRSDFSTMSTEKAVEIAINITKSNMQVPKISNEEALNVLEADQISVDQLLMMPKSDDEPGPATVCRHYTAITIAIFEEIQALAQEAGNEDIGNVVAFENYMAELGHGTVGFARSNEVTVIDPFEFAQRKGGTAEATFDGRHGNIGSLYRTLSQTPPGQTDQRIFDMGSADQMIEEFAAQKKEMDVDQSTLDNSHQMAIMRVKELLDEPNLRTPEKLAEGATRLQILANDLISSRTPSSSTTKMYLNSVLYLGEKLTEIVTTKMEDPNNSPAKKELLKGTRIQLRLLVITPTAATLTGEATEQSLVSEYENMQIDGELSKENKEYIEAKTGEMTIQIAYGKFRNAVYKGNNVSTNFINPTTKEVKAQKGFRKNYGDPAREAFKTMKDFIGNNNLTRFASVNTMLNKFYRNINTANLEALSAAEELQEELMEETA